MRFFVLRLLRDVKKLTRGSLREAVLLAAAALILIGLTGFSFWIGQRTVADRDAADALSAFDADVIRFGQMLRTVESSQRGFIITGDETFLEPFHTLAGRLAPLAQELETRATQTLPGATANIAALAPLLDRKLKIMAETQRLVRAGEKEAATALIAQETALRLTSRIERAVQAVEDEANAQVKADDLKLDRLETLGTFTDAAGAVLILTFSFVALFLLLRSNALMRDAQDAVNEVNAELDDTVKRRTAALVRANQEIQRFAYIVSHDLRAPLVNIVGFTAELEVLQKDLFDKLKAGQPPVGREALADEFAEAFRFIRASSERMDRLISAILKLSREGNRPLKRETIDMNAMVATIVAGHEHQIREKDIAVTIGPLPRVDSDRLAVEQIFSNLIENAIKFLRPEVRGEINIDGQLRGTDASFTISDNGRGIAAADHARIFELFRRAAPPEVPGEGMGLAYVNTLLLRLGGRVEVRSSLGHGSTFTITLPKALTPETRIAA